MYSLLPNDLIFSGDLIRNKYEWIVLGFVKSYMALEMFQNAATPTDRKGLFSLFF